MSDQQNGSTGSRIDLASVPEPMRSLLLKQLAHLPASMREQLLREGSPLLDRMIAKARERASSAPAAMPIAATASVADSVRDTPDRSGPDRVPTVRHSTGAAAPSRVQTVSPGDSANGGVWLIACVIALAVAAYFALNG